MNIKQLQLFQTKDTFNSEDFESQENQEFFSNIALSVSKGFNSFTEDDKLYYDNSTKSSMLNNAITNSVQKDCANKQFKFIDSLSNTRRSFGILNEKFLVLFKKHPVSNVKTKQDDLIKNQHLDKHVIFLTYEIDQFWSEIKKLEFRFYSSPKTITYTNNITHLIEEPKVSLVTDMESIPLIKLKKELKKPKKSLNNNVK